MKGGREEDGSVRLNREDLAGLGLIGIDADIPFELERLLLRERDDVPTLVVDVKRSTISREVRRNLSSQGRYTPTKADSYAVARRRRSRRNARFGAGGWMIVDQLLEADWSPEQVSGWLRLHRVLSISHETIYLHVWRDKREGGELWKHLRQATKKRRKRNGSRDSRGRLAGKRHISERPPEVEDRQTPGHWEIDTVKGDDQARHSVVTIVERKTGLLVMGKLERHCAADTTARSIELILRHAGRFATITSDNGSEFHSYKHIEQADCDAIAAKLNSRPRKRLGYRTPEECHAQS